MLSFVILLIVFTSNVMSWEGYHTEFDDELPLISPKNCGISRRTCGPNSTFDDPFVSSRIREGEYANEGELPWFLLIEDDYSGTLCGASIISEWWALTAAHCVYRTNIGKPGFVAGFVLIGNGRRDLPTTYRYEVEKVVIHKNYMNLHEGARIFSDRMSDIKSQFSKWEKDGKPLKTFPGYEDLKKELSETEVRHLIYVVHAGQWDLALLKVRQRMVPIFNETHYIINSVCLPKYGIINSKRESMVVMGMGITGEKGTPDYFPDSLKKGVTRMLTQKECEEDPAVVADKAKYYYYSYQICAKRIKDANTSLTRAGMCPGDSGSPAIQYIGCKAVQVGINSYALGDKRDTCEMDMLVHARVSLYMPWIRYIIHYPKITATYGKSYGSESSSDDYPVSKPLILFTNLVVLSAVVLILIAVWLLAIVLINSKHH